MKERKLGKYKVVSPIRFNVFLLIVVFILVATIIGFRHVLNSATRVDAYGYYQQVEVKEGDTLWDYAEKYSDGKRDLRKIVYEIEEINELDSPEVKAGDILIIPVYNKDVIEESKS